MLEFIVFIWFSISTIQSLKFNNLSYNWFTPHPLSCIRGLLFLTGASWCLCGRYFTLSLWLHVTSCICWWYEIHLICFSHLGGMDSWMCKHLLWVLFQLWILVLDNYQCMLLPLDWSFIFGISVEIGHDFFVTLCVAFSLDGFYVCRVAVTWYRVEPFMYEMVVTLIFFLGMPVEHMKHFDSWWYICQRDCSLIHIWGYLLTLMQCLQQVGKC